MILQDGDAKVELNIIGYMFPQLEDKRWDSDWLIIQLNLDLPIGNWGRSDSCITTFEVARLIGWLEEVYKKFEVFEDWHSGRLEAQINFTEPSLEFEVHSNHSGYRRDPNVYLRVYFAVEFLPPFKDQMRPYLNPEDVDNVYLDFSITPAQILEIIESLRSQLEQFPVRVGLP